MKLLITTQLTTRIALKLIHDSPGNMLTKIRFGHRVNNNIYLYSNGLKFMHINSRKALFSEGYLLALCAHAGVNSGTYRIDDDSVDVTLTKKGSVGTGLVYSPKLDVQLKCTSQVTAETTESFSFRLERKNYDDLRAVNSSSPRILLVLRVPDIELDWVQINPNDISLKHSAYWLSLKGLGEIDQETMTVQIPKRNRMTSESLNNIFTLIGSGEQL